MFLILDHAQLDRVSVIASKSLESDMHILGALESRLFDFENMFLGGILGLFRCQSLVAFEKESVMIARELWSAGLSRPSGNSAHPSSSCFESVKWA